jgi:hypothetical protein
MGVLKVDLPYRERDREREREGGRETETESQRLGQEKGSGGGKAYSGEQFDSLAVAGDDAGHPQVSHGDESILFRNNSSSIQILLQGVQIEPNEIPRAERT